MAQSTSKVPDETPRPASTGLFQPADSHLVLSLAPDLQRSGLLTTDKLLNEIPEDISPKDTSFSPLNLSGLVTGDAPVSPKPVTSSEAGGVKLPARPRGPLSAGEEAQPQFEADSLEEREIDRAEDVHEPLRAWTRVRAQERARTPALEPYRDMELGRLSEDDHVSLSAESAGSYSSDDQPLTIPEALPASTPEARHWQKERSLIGPLEGHGTTTYTEVPTHRTTMVED